MSQEVNVNAEINRDIHISARFSWLLMFAFCFTVSLMFLLICTKSSPFYPLNDWVDSNAYFTVGKGMMNGLVPYRDLFDQKGPLLFLIHGIAYLVSNTTFLGVFIVEVISFSVFLYYCHKIILLFIDIKYSILSLPLIAAIVLNMKAFSYGDSAEEWCIPLITICLFYLLDYFKNVYPKTIDSRRIIVSGFLAGCVLWIKFTLLGFWIGWIFAISMPLLFNKEYGRLVKKLGVFLGGIFLATIPWIGYFGINRSIGEWLQNYLYVNVFYYSAQLSFLERITEAFMHFGLNPIFGGIFIVGTLSFTRDSVFINNRSHRLSLLMCILLSFLLTYVGGTAWVHYFLILSPFAVLGIIAIMNMLRNYYDSSLSSERLAVTVLLVVLIPLLLTVKFNHNAYMLNTDNEDLFQNQFAAAINKDGGKTLLNYGGVDLGLYTVTNITPNVKFFYKPAFDYSRFPIIMDEQNRYIEEKSVDYIVIMQPASQNAHTLNVPDLYDNYTLVMEIYSKIEMDKYMRRGANLDVHYLLFEVR